MFNIYSMNLNQHTPYKTLQYLKFSYEYFKEITALIFVYNS